MKKLTPNQISAIQTLAGNPLIHSTDIEFHNNGLSRITIKSVVGVDWNEVDNALLALDEEFPNLEYRGLPVRFDNPLERADNELYFLDFEGETLISLIMRMEPVKEKVVVGSYFRNEG